MAPGQKIKLNIDKTNGLNNFFSAAVEFELEDTLCPIDAKFPNQLTGTADKFAFRKCENR